MRSFQLRESGPDTYGLGVSGRRYWWRTGRKIALKSAHATIFATLLPLPLSLFGFGFPGLPSALMAMTLVVSVLMGWVGCFLWTGFVALIVLPCLSLSQRILAEPFRRDTTGWLAGSAVAITASGGGLVHPSVLYLRPATMIVGVSGWLVFSLLGALVGISAAQFGGYLGSIRSLRERRRRPVPSQAPRFTDWRLLAVTAILSALMSVVRLAGDFALPMIMMALVNAGIAWGIHRPVAWATNRWLDWRLAKRRKKRAARLVTPPATRVAPSSS